MRYLVACVLAVVATVEVRAAGTPPRAPILELNGKTVKIESVEPSFVNLAEIRDVKAYRGTIKETGASCMIVKGIAVCHSAFPDCVITVELDLFLSRQNLIIPRGTISTTIERPAQDKAVTFTILAPPIAPDTNREAWIKDGWKQGFALRAKLAPFVPK